jgi:lipoprotein LpqH
MKRLFLVAVAGAAVVVTCLTGCGEEKSSATTETTTTAATATAGASQAKVLINGEDQNIQGPVACTPTGDSVKIAIGDAPTPPVSLPTTRGIGVVLDTTTEPPMVESVGPFTFAGVDIGYPPSVGVNQDPGQVTKDGNTYKITGTLTGIYQAYPTQFDPYRAGFEINVTCP